MKNVIMESVAKKHPEIVTSYYQEHRIWGKWYKTAATDKQLKKLGCYRCVFDGTPVWGFPRKSKPIGDGTRLESGRV